MNNEPGAAEVLRGILQQLDSKSYELCEVKKAEERARRENFNGATVTEARERAAAAASEYVIEAIDIQADVDSLLRWRDYWTLLVSRGE